MKNFVLNIATRCQEIGVTMMMSFNTKGIES